MQNLNELESLLITAQQTDRFIIVMVVVLLSLIAVGLYLVNRRQTNKFEFLLKQQEQEQKLRQQQSQQQAEERQAKMREESERRRDKERQEMASAQQEMFNKTFELVSQQFNAGLVTLSDSDKKITESLEILVTESREERADYLARLTRIEQSIDEQVGSADIRLRKALDDHNHQAMSRYAEISKGLSNVQAQTDGILKLLESGKDCSREVVVELNKAIRVLHGLVETMKPDEPDPKPPKIVGMKPDMPAEDDAGEDDDESEEKAA